jgi:hypothetical protein
MTACGETMAKAEGKATKEVLGRTLAAQSQLVYSPVHGQPYRDRLFESFQPFSGIFPVDPWKPDSRQIAQQAMFLYSADTTLSFTQNLVANGRPQATALYRFVLPSSLRTEVLDRLASMNVTAATLFPDLSGLARSLRTLPIKRN